jgi:MFS transporter, SP family, sugar:H+ symporter
MYDFFKKIVNYVSSYAGLVNVFSTFIATITADKVGRRALFLQGGTQMIISQVPLHTYSSVIEFHKA